MSEDNVDNLVVELVRLIETWPKNWPDIDECYDAFSEKCYEKLEPFITKDRNYN